VHHFLSPWREAVPRGRPFPFQAARRARASAILSLAAIFWATVAGPLAAQSGDPSARESLRRLGSGLALHVARPVADGSASVLIAFAGGTDSEAPAESGWSLLASRLIARGLAAALPMDEGLGKLEAFASEDCFGASFELPEGGLEAALEGLGSYLAAGLPFDPSLVPEIASELAAESAALSGQGGFDFGAALAKALYGADAHRLLAAASPKSLMAASPEGLRSFIAKRALPSSSFLSLRSGLDSARLAELADRALKSWAPSGAASKAPALAEPKERAPVYRISGAAYLAEPPGGPGRFVAEIAWAGPLVGKDPKQALAASLLGAVASIPGGSFERGALALMPDKGAGLAFSAGACPVRRSGSPLRFGIEGDVAGGTSGDAHSALAEAILVKEAVKAFATLFTETLARIPDAEFEAAKASMLASWAAEEAGPEWQRAACELWAAGAEALIAGRSTALKALTKADVAAMLRSRMFMREAAIALWIAPSAFAPLRSAARSFKFEEVAPGKAAWWAR